MRFVWPAERLVGIWNVIGIGAQRRDHLEQQRRRNGIHCDLDDFAIVQAHAPASTAANGYTGST